jgi:possible outer wedge baseplate protein and lysozyme
MNQFLYVDYINSSDVVQNKSAIDNSIKNILTTRRGSMPGKPEFGVNIEELLFEPLDHNLINYIKNIIYEVLYKYEPRIYVNNVIITEQPEFNRIIIEIQYYYTYIKTEDFLTTKLLINI